MSPRCRSLMFAIACAFPGGGLAADRPPKPPDAKELGALWADLASVDAVVAYRAICRLGNNSGPAVPFLRSRLRPVPPLDEKLVARLFVELDDDNFEVREKAQKALVGFGQPVSVPARKALEGKLSPEVRSRLKAVIEQLSDDVPSAETLRDLRAVEALERMGTDEARKLVKELAGGAPSASLTREAQSSLSRMTAKP